MRADGHDVGDVGQQVGRLGGSVAARQRVQLACAHGTLAARVSRVVLQAAVRRQGSEHSAPEGRETQVENLASCWVPFVSWVAEPLCFRDS